MTNIFSIIKQSILNNYSPTYGEILNENKTEQFNNAVQSMCSDDEFEQYNAIMNMDKQRLIRESQAPHQEKIIKPSQSTVNIAGIGEVSQIC